MTGTSASAASPLISSSTSKPDMSGSFEIEHHAVEGPLAQHGERVGAGTDGFDVDVLVAEQPRHAHPLGGVVLHDEQALRRGSV